jgi:hypothetical protein
MARTLAARGLGAPTLTLVPPADVWAVPTVELHRFLEEVAEQLAVLVGPLHDALSGRRPELPPIDQIDVALLALGAALDGVKHWRRGGGCPTAEPVPGDEARLLWEAHDAACALISRLRLVALAKRRGDRRPWMSLSLDSIEEAFGALSRLGLLVLPPPPERVTEPCPPQAPYAEILQAWREAQDGVELDAEAGEP